MLARLKTIEGQGRGDVVSLDGYETVTVGRSHENSIQVNEPDVSRVHCRIERFGAVWRLRDEQSHNGTLVNGEAADGVILKRGDNIRVGHTTFVLELLPGAATVPDTSEATAVEETADASHIYPPTDSSPATPSAQPTVLDAPAPTRSWANPAVFFAASFLLTLAIGAAVLALRGSEHAPEKDTDSDLVNMLPAEDLKRSE